MVSGMAEGFDSSTQHEKVPVPANGKIVDSIRWDDRVGKTQSRSRFTHFPPMKLTAFPRPVFHAAGFCRGRHSRLRQVSTVADQTAFS